MNTDCLDFGLTLTSIYEAIMDRQKFFNLLEPFKKAFEACIQEELWEYANYKATLGSGEIEYDFDPVSLVVHFDKEDNKYHLIITFDNGFFYKEKISVGDKIPTMLDFKDFVNEGFYRCYYTKHQK